MKFDTKYERKHYLGEKTPVNYSPNRLGMYQPMLKSQT